MQDFNAFFVERKPSIKTKPNYLSKLKLLENFKGEEKQKEKSYVFFNMRK